MGREFVRNTSKNLIKRTIFSFAKVNIRYPFVADSMGLDRNLTISDQRILPCLPAPVPTAGGAGRDKIFSGISDEFWKVCVSN